MAEIKSVDARIRENNKARVALDKQISGLRKELAALNDEARVLDGELRNSPATAGREGDGAVDGVTVAAGSRSLG